MNIPASSRPSLHRVRAFIVAAGAFVLATGALSVAGWLLDIARLASWDGRIAMQPNASVAAAAAGAAILCLAFAARRAAAAFAALAGAIGAATLFQHLSGLDVGIDRLLLLDRTWGAAATVAPGRMGPPASTSFSLLGLGLLVSALAPASSRLRRVAPLLGLAVVLVTFFSLTGYLVGARALYAKPWLSAIAMQTAVALFVAGAGLIASLPDQEPARTLLDLGAGGAMARRTLPVILTLPPLLAWVRTRAEAAGHVDPPTARALLVAALTTLLAAVAWAAVASLARRDAVRRDAEERLAAELAERRNAEEAASRRKEQFETLLEEAPIGVYLVDSEMRVVEMNPTARAAFGPGAAPGKPLGELLRERLSELDAEEVLRRFRETLATGAPHVNPEFATDRRDRGVRETYEWRIVRILLPDGRHGVVCYFRDVSQQVATRESIRESERRLREADRKKDEFLATLAHELRNPLAPIMNSLELLRLAENDPAVLRSARETMDRQLRQMVRLVDDLLDIGRITRDRLELRRETVRLDEVVRLAVEATFPIAQSMGHRLDVRLPAEPLHLDADPTRLTQVFGNVLHNAFKFTPPGGRVLLTAERAGGDVVVRVRDEGIGIPPEQIGSVFDMFTQLDAGAERARSGLGIGLTLVKRLVEMHGGSVMARSEGAGRGSEFEVRLPLVQPAARDGPPRAEPSAGLRSEPAGKRRILVVDDNRDSALTMAAMLRKAGDEAIVAHDGPQALRLAESEQPDAILLDIGLPGMDGYEVCRAIRAQPWGRRPQVVAVTGWGQERDRALSKDAGFDAHLVKPVDRKALLAALDTTREPLHRGGTEIPETR